MQLSYHLFLCSDAIASQIQINLITLESYLNP